MAGLQDYRTWDGTVPAGEERNIHGRGRYISCLEANIDFKISVDDSTPQFMAAGLARFTRDGEIYKLVTIDNSAGGVALVVKLALGEGELRDNRLTVTGSIKSDIGDNLTSFPDVAVATVTTAQLAAANANRRRLIVSNPATNPREVRIADSNAGAARGFELPPGAWMDFRTTAAVHAYNPHGAAQVLNVISEDD